MTRLRASFDRVNGSYHARFVEMQALGEALSLGSSEMLGQLQYQDVVRQCVERLRAAVARRNPVLGGAFAGPGGTPDQGGGPAIELF